MRQASTDQEVKDLEKMRQRIDEIRIALFRSMKTVFRCNKEELANAGFGSLGDALIFFLSDAIKKEEKLMQDHLKKYPDK